MDGSSTELELIRWWWCSEHWAIVLDHQKHKSLNSIIGVLSLFHRMKFRSSSPSRSTKRTLQPVKTKMTKTEAVTSWRNWRKCPARCCQEVCVCGLLFFCVMQCHLSWRSLKKDKVINKPFFPLSRFQSRIHWLHWHWFAWVLGKHIEEQPQVCRHFFDSKSFAAQFSCH